MARIRFFRQMFLDNFRSALPSPHRLEPETWSTEAVTGSCLGHSTVLLNFFGAWLLTDPIFSMRAGLRLGPLVIGPKRYLRPALALRELPKIDVILLSHAHFDHFDVASLAHFPPETIVVTATGTADLLRRFRKVHELAWGQTIELQLSGGQMKITAAEVNHWGARMLRDDHRGYNAYVIEKAGRRVCYGGDTARTDAFARLGKSGKTIDLILMPIGAYNPWIRAHCTPEEAAEMAEEAGAQHFVPIHHETFKLSSEPMTEPAERIQAAFKEQPGRLLAVHVGETFRLPLSSSDHESRPN